MKKKSKKNKNINQKSFYFKDYLETNQKYKKNSNSLISEDRVYILFFFFISLILIFSIKISIVSLQDSKYSFNKQNNSVFLQARRDVVDRNGELLSRNIEAYHAAVRSKFVKDKKKFLIKTKIIFPEINSESIKKKLEIKKYFYLKKGLSEEEKDKLWNLGEKGIFFESYQRRFYPHGSLYSHILGQIDNDNYGISGIERYFDKQLRNLNEVEKPLILTVDTNIQYLIKKELLKAMNDFKANGAAGVLLNSTSGEVLSLVSLPDYNINIRKNINDKSYTNKITKGLYELGSVFKTFTVALAIDEKILEPNTMIKDITEKYKCSVHEITDIHKFPKVMSVEDILIQSSNVGVIQIAKKIGKEKLRYFLKELNLFNSSNLELDEVSSPSKLNWNHACKLETVSFGHGILTSPIQVAAAYGVITNGGYSVKPTLIKDTNKNIVSKKIISEETSYKINKILRKVVTDKKGTASLANIYGYQVGGKTGTAQNYKREKVNINTFISAFPIENPKYILLIMLDDPKPAPHIIYNYRGKPTKVNRNEAGWNSVYVSGKIIEKIGPILAINNEEFNNKHVVKKLN